MLGRGCGGGATWPRTTRPLDEMRTRTMGYREAVWVDSRNGRLTLPMIVATRLRCASTRQGGRSEGRGGIDYEHDDENEDDGLPRGGMVRHPLCESTPFREHVTKTNWFSAARTVTIWGGRAAPLETEQMWALTPGGGRLGMELNGSVLTRGYYHVIPTGFRLGSLRSQERALIMASGHAIRPVQRECSVGQRM